MSNLINSYRYGGVSSVIPLANIIEYWNMNGNSNGYNGNDGIDTDMTYPSSTLIDEAADFTSTTNSKTNVANTGGVFTFGNGTTDSPFSYSFWVKWDTITTCYLFNLRASGANEWEVAFVPNNIRVRLLSQDTTTNRKQVQKPFTPSTGVWYNIAMTYSGTGYPTVYLNGVEGTNNDSTTGTYVAMQSTTAVLGIGGLVFNTAFRTVGQMDEVVITDNELSASEITDLYNAGIAGTPVIG